MKSRYIIVLILVLVTSSTGLLAQDRYNTIGLNLGIGSIKKQDLIFSPFIYQDLSPLNFMLSYERSRQLEHVAQMKFAQYSGQTGELFSYHWDGETNLKYAHSFVLVDLNYSLGKKILENVQWQCTVGGRIRNRIHIANYDFGAAAPFGYHIPIGLDAWIRLSRQVGSKHRITTNLNLPLFSYVARSPYLGQDAHYMERISVHGDLKIFWEHIKSGQLQSWGTSKIIDFNLAYDYSLSDRWKLGASYWFSMNHNSSPVKHNAYENVIYIGTKFKF